MNPWDLYKKADPAPDAPAAKGPWDLYKKAMPQKLDAAPTGDVSEDPVPGDRSRMPWYARVAGAVGDHSRLVGNSILFNMGDKVTPGMQFLVDKAFSHPTHYEADVAKERQRTADARARIHASGGGTWATIPESVPLVGGTPIGLDTMDDIGGSVVGGAGLAKSGLTLAGKGLAKSSSLISKAVLGGADAGAQGAAYNLGGQDKGSFWDYLKAAGKGFGTGFTLGAAGHAAPQAVLAATRLPGSVARKLGADASEFQRVNPLARRMVNDMATVDNITPADAGRFGPLTMMPDLGRQSQAMARGAVQRPTAEATATLGKLTERELGRNSRLQVDVHNAIGSPTSDATQYVNTLKAQRGAISPEYDAAFAASPPIDLNPVASKVEAMLKTARGPEQAALKYLRDQMVLTKAVPAQRIRVGGVMRTIPAKAEVLVSDPRTVHSLKVAADNLIDYGDDSLGIKAAALAAKEGAAKVVRGDLRKALSAVPGYDALAQASGNLAKRIEGYQYGNESTLNNPKEFPSMTFQDTLDANGGLARPDIAEGVKAKIWSNMGNAPDDLRTLRRDVGGDPTDFNGQKVARIFGPEKQAQMQKGITREETFQRTNRALQGGSDTAGKIEGSQAVEDAARFFPRFSPGATDVPFRIASWMLNKVAGNNVDSVRRAISRVSGLQGPALEKFLQDLRAYQAHNQAASKVGRLTASGLLGTNQDMHRPGGY